MSKKKNLNIEIDPDSIPTKPLDKIPFKEIMVPDELDYVEKPKKKGGVSLNVRDGLRLAERFVNKWFGYLIGNNENPIPKVNFSKMSLVYIIIIVVLVILLWI